MKMPTRIDPSAIHVGGARSQSRPTFNIEFGESIFNAKPKEWMIEGLCGWHDLAMLFGDSGIGKTYVVVDLITAAITGVKFAGRFEITKPLNVLYASSEGRDGIRARFKHAFERAGVSPKSEPAARFAFLADTPNLYPGRDKDNSQVDAFLEDLQGVRVEKNWRADLIVLDTLADASLGARENDNTDMGLVLASAFRVMRGAEAALLFVHHAGKDGATYRGASAIRGKMDSVWEIVGSSETRVLSCQKSRDAEPFEPQRFRICSGKPAAHIEWLGSAGPDRARDRRSALLEQVVEVLRNGGAFGRDKAIWWSSIREQLQVTPTPKVLQETLRQASDGIEAQIRAVYKPIIDRHGKQNREGWHYYLPVRPFGGAH